MASPPAVGRETVNLWERAIETCTAVLSRVYFTIQEIKLLEGKYQLKLRLEMCTLAVYQTSLFQSVSLYCSCHLHTGISHIMFIIGLEQLNGVKVSLFSASTQQHLGYLISQFFLYGVQQQKIVSFAGGLVFAENTFFLHNIPLNSPSKCMLPQYMQTPVFMCVTTSLLENVYSGCVLSVAIQKVRFQEERVCFVKSN